MKPMRFSVGAPIASLALLLMVLSVCAAFMATPPMNAYAAPGASAPETTPDKAKLTKVIDAPLGTDASNDRYTFHFAGGGTATSDGSGGIVSDGVKQSSTIHEGYSIPVLADLELRGTSVSEGNSVGDGTFKQTTTSASLSYILGLDNTDKPYADAPDRAKAHFAHSGMYTYEVTETGTTSQVSGVYVIRSRASYLLRVYVSIDGTDTKIDKVTVEKTAIDEGTQTDPSVKVDSTLPETDDVGRITEDDQPITTPAGDFRGRDVYGFTFANEYVKGGHFIVENKTEGSYADPDKLFPTSIVIEDSAAPAGCCITYNVIGGEDTTINSEPLDGRVDPSEIEQCAKFQGDGMPLRIQANLKHGGRITITGLYGKVQESPVDAAGNTRNKLSDGPNQGSLYAVSEAIGDNEPYRVKGMVYGTANVAVDAEGDVTSSPIATVDGNGSGVSIGNPSKRTLGGVGEYVLIVNSLEATDFSPTGIIANNLPRALLIGLPLVVLAVWLVRRWLKRGKLAR